MWTLLLLGFMEQRFISRLSRPNSLVVEPKTLNETAPLPAGVSVPFAGFTRYNVLPPAPYSVLPISPNPTSPVLLPSGVNTPVVRSWIPNKSDPLRLAYAKSFATHIVATRKHAAAQMNIRFLIKWVPQQETVHPISAEWKQSALEKPKGAWPVRSACPKTIGGLAIRSNQTLSGTMHLICDKSKGRRNTQEFQP